MHQPVPRLDCLPPRRLVLDVAPHLGRGVLLQRQSGRVHLQGRQGAALHAAPGLRGSALGLLGTSLGLQERATLKHHFRDYTHILMGWDAMIWLTRGIPYYFQNFDSFYPLFSPKKTHPLCITSLIFPKTRGIPYYFQNFDSFYP